MQFINLLRENNAKIAILDIEVVLLDQYVLVASTQDPAGTSMVDNLRESHGFERDANARDTLVSRISRNVCLHLSSADVLHREELDEIYPEAKAFVFLSRHKSDSKIPTLTCHCTGNFGGNPYGGNPKEIAISFPSLQKSYLKALVNVRQRVPEYEIVIEATHHGPTSLRKPVLFVELGSSAGQWSDKNAASTMCDVLISVIQKGLVPCSKVGIALGGTHYPEKFSQLLIESEFGLAAVASKHNLEWVDENMFKQMISKSVEKVTTIVLDARGLGSHKDRILRMAEDCGLEILKLK